MNAPVLLAQLSGSTPAVPQPPKNLKIEKPANGQALTFHLDGNTRLDLSDIASEKLTFVKVGEKLIILFDNQSTVTVDPVFDSAGNPLNDIGFQVGDRTLTGDQFATLFPIGTDQSVLPAAGPSGPTAGANFHDAQVAGLGPGGNPLALLGDENSGGTLPGGDEAAIPAIIVGTAGLGEIDDEGLPDGIADGPGDVAGMLTTVTLSLNLNFGSAGTSGATLAFLASQPDLAGLTSGGQPVNLLVSNPPGGTPTLIGFVGSDPDAPGSHVFEITLGLNTVTGEYTFTLLRPLDHPDHGTEDTTPLVIHYSATNAAGSVFPTFTVNVNDDSPDLDPKGFDQPLGENEIPQNLQDPTSGTSVRSGTLGVLWGADNFNEHENGGVSATTGQNGDRSIVFTNTTVDLSSGEVSLSDALYSHGEPVQYELANNGTLLIAFTGQSPAEDQSNWVFTVSLSDTGTGSYVFTQYQELDHVGVQEQTGEEGEEEQTPLNLDSLDLTFHYTATDSDGDAIDRTFSVAIKDDAPTQTTAEITGTAAENDLADFNPFYPLLFNFWQGSLGTSPYDGTQSDQSHTGLLGTVPVWGNLSSLVNPGADAPGEFHLVSESQAESVLAHLGADGGLLKSHGDVVNDTRLVDIPGIGEAMGFFASDGRLVFGLFVDADGNYNFRLFDQIDHAPPTQGENGEPVADANSLNIDLSQFVTYTDFDQDTITLDSGSLSVNVIDDVPVVVGHEAVTANENDLADFNLLYPLVFDFWQGSLGSSPYDGGDEDNSYTGLLGTVTAWGVLADNILGGADEFGKFELVSEGRANDLLAHLGPNGWLKSHGEIVDDARMVDIPGIGEVMGFFAHDGRLVFGLFVSENGIYNFRLFDQIDHAPPAQGANGAPVAIEDSLLIDLSKFVTYTDYDQDTIDLGTGTFVVDVVDDIPHVIGSLTVTLGESHLNNFLPAWDLIPDAIKALYPVEGSTGTDPNADTDVLLNTTSQQGLLNEIIGNNLVHGGADEFGKFGMVSEGRANLLLGTMGLESKDEAIDHVRLVEIDGLGTVMGFFAGDRVVFTLTVTEAGFYDLRLFDQIDHTGANGSSLNIDLSKFVTYTDYDGDVVDLGTDTLILTVVDDAPQFVPGAQVFGTVEEEQIDLIGSLLGGDMAHGNEDSNSDAGDDLDTGGLLGNLATTNTTIGSLAALVKVGADENGTFAFDQAVVGRAVLDSNGNPVTSHNQAVTYGLSGNQLIGIANDDGDGILETGQGERIVFSVSLGDINPLDNLNNDLFTFTLLDQIDHAKPNGQSTEDLKNLDLSSTIVFTDFDGDSTGLGPKSFQIKVIDDTPRQTGSTIKRTVEEEHNAGSGTPEMNHGNEDTANEPLVIGIDFNTNTVSGNLGSLVSVGGDEVSKATILGIPVYYGTFSFGDTSNLPTIESKGANVLYSLSDSNGDGLNDTLIGTADGREVFTLTIVSNTGGGKTAGDYTFTLLDQIDHPDGNGENIANLDFSSVVQFSDYDGDTITLWDGSFSIDVIDDQPTSKGNVTESTVLDDEGQTTFVPANTGGTGDASDAKVVAAGAAKSLFSIGADDLGSITLTKLPSFSVLYADANGFAVSEQISWNDPTTSANGTMNVTAYSDHHTTAATLIINIDGSYTFTMNAPVVHPTNQTSEEEVSLKFEYTVTDFDKDSVNGSLTIKVDDDTPKLTTPSVTAQLDDEAQSLFPGNPNGTGDVANAKEATGGPGALFTAGADGVKLISATPGVFSVIYEDANGLARPESVTWSGGVKGANGSTTWTATSEHYGDDHPAATLVINVDGSYKFTLNAPVKNDATSSTTEENLTIGISFKVTDGDGDESSAGTLTIKVNDDTPTVGQSQTAITVDEEGLGGNPRDTYAATNPHDASTALASTSGTLNYSFGADGPSAASNVTFLTSNLLALALKSGGQPLSYGWDQDTHTLTATANNETVFTLQVTDILTGAYTFTLSKPLDHLGPNSVNSEDDITIPFQFTITDGDGDTTNVATVSVTINDDAPTFTAGLVQNKTVDEEGISGNPGAPAPYASSDEPGQALTASGNLGISWGADNGNSGPANRSLAFSGFTEGGAVLDDNGIAITSHKAAVHYHLVTNGDVQTLIGYVGSDPNNVANHVFTVTLDDSTSAGTYNFTLLKNIDHPTANSEDDISIKFNFTATDADKDSVAGSFKVTIDDDSPMINAASVQDGAVDEDNLSTGNHDSAAGDLTPAQGDDGDLAAHGSLGISYGADGPADLAHGAIVTETHAFNFNNGTNVGPGFSVYAYETRGNHGFTSLVGAYTAPITITSTDGYPFSLTSVKLGLNGAAANQFVEIFGLDANGNPIPGVYANVSIPVLTPVDTGETTVTFLANAAFNNVQVYGLKIQPVSGFSGRVYVDDLNIASIVSDLSSTIVDGPVTFSDHAVAANNVEIKDSNGDTVLLSQLMSDGQPVHFKLLDALTLVAYTGSEPSSIGASNVVFSVVLSGAGSGSYDFVLKGPLDHPLGGTEDDLVFTFKYTAKDFDGDTTGGSFHVTVDDDMPTADPQSIVIDEDVRIASVDHIAIETGALAIDWGSDGANTLAIGTTVQVTGLAAGDTLHSNGKEVFYGLIGGALVGFIKNTPADAVPLTLDDARVVFSVEVSAASAGSYVFTLRQPLDHSGPAGAPITLSFSVTGADGDGDPLSIGFAVQVDPAGYIGSIHYDDLTTGVFVNLDGAAHTVDGQLVAKDTATDIAASATKIVGIDNVAGIVDAFGGKGDDILIGSGEGNVLSGGAGQDLLVVVPDTVVPSGSAARTFDHGDGTSESIDIAGLAGEGDALHGGTGYDTVQLDLGGTNAPGFVFDRANLPGTLDGVERFIGTDGDDVIMLPTNYTTDGSGVTVNGGKGNDVISGSNNVESLFGGEGSDKISGLGGDDVIHGNSGDDTIWGGAGNDAIFGDFGDDTITGGLGDDALDGGNGNDAFIYKVGDGHDTIDGGAGTSDRLNVNGNNQNQTFALTSTPSGFTIEADGDSNPEITATAVEKVNIAVAGGHDAVTINDRGSDNVIITGATGDFSVDGGNLPDIRVLNTGTLDFRFNGGTGNDHIDASGLNAAGSPQTLNVTLDGGDGNDTIIGSNGNDALIGDTGDDTFIYTTGNGADIVDGGADNDELLVYGNGNANAFAVTNLDGDSTSLEVTVDGATSLVKNVEDITITGGGGGDTLTVAGNLGGTGLAMSTINFDAGAGNDTLDLTGQLSAHRVVSDGGADYDIVKFGFAYPGLANVTKEFDGDGHLIGATITYTIDNEQVTSTFTNYEEFRFIDGTRTLESLFNSPPETLPGAGAGNEDTLIAITLSGTDVDNNLVGYVITSLPSHGTLFLNADGTGAVAIGTVVTGATVYFKPDANWSGTVTFGYAAKDAEGVVDATPAVATIDVAPVADAPTLTIASIGIGNATPVPAGHEFLVHPSSSGAEYYSTVTSLTGGGFVVNWVLDSFVYGQRFDANGNMLSGPFLLSTTLTGDRYPTVTGLPNGGFIAVWEGNGTSGSGVYFRTFDANGLGGNEVFAGGGSTPAITASDDGIFISWKAGAVVGQALDLDGHSLSAAIPVSSGSAICPEVAALSGGGYILTWTEAGQVRSQLFDSAGAPVGPFEVAVTGGALYATVASLADGGYAVAWLANGNLVKARVFDADGTPSGSEIVVGSGSFNSIAGTPDGGFVVMWNNVGDVFAARFDALGHPLGAPFVMNETLLGNQYIDPHVPGAPTLAILNDGSLVATWMSSQNGNMDIYARKFLLPEGITTNEDTAIATAISIGLTDIDGSEHIASVVLSGLPAGTLFNAGHVDPSDATKWIIENPSAATLSALTMTPPQDYNGNFTLTVTATSLDQVTLSDGVHTSNATTTKTITVQVNPVNDAPVIDSNGGGDTATISVAENTAFVTTVHATDADGQALIYAISGGADASLFTIDSVTGALSFNAAPDFENPQDVGNDNHYNVIVTASDGTLLDTQALDIQVTDVAEVPLNVAPTPNSDHIYTNIGTGSPVVIPVAGLLWNDTDPDSVLSIKTLTGATFTDSTHQFVQISSPALNADAQFSYTVTDGINPESTPVTVTVTHVGSLTTTNQADFLIDAGNTTWTPSTGNGKDIIVVGSSATNIVHGDNDADLLFTNGNGTNILWGDNGNDTLVVRGNNATNELHGGNGVDTFSFLAGWTGNGLNTISDFDTGPGGDILDLSGLLDSISGNKADHVRFVYGNGSTHLLSDEANAPPAVEGNVTVQVNLSGSNWINVATMVDTGSNLSMNSNVINTMLDHATIQQFHV